MLIKAAADQTTEMDSLSRFAAEPGSGSLADERARNDARVALAALRARAEAAQEIDALYGDSRNWMVLHDLRLESDGRAAVIDHLLVNRVLEIYLCESRPFADGVAINDLGEFSAFLGLDPRPIPSPLEQNRRRMRVLSELFESGRITLPARDGTTLLPVLQGIALLGRRARISRPKTLIPGIESVVKSDQLNAYLERRAERAGPSALANAVDAVTLEAFARRIAAAHRPGPDEIAPEVVLHRIDHATSAPTRVDPTRASDSPPSAATSGIPSAAAPAQPAKPPRGRPRKKHRERVS